MQHKAEAEGLNFVKDFATLEESKFYIINPSLIKQQKPIQKPKMYVRIRHTAVSVIIKKQHKNLSLFFLYLGSRRRQRRVLLFDTYHDRLLGISSLHSI
jgi:hypothetical protein